MLARKNYISLGFQASLAIGLLSGCIITESPTSGGTGGQSSTATTTAATTGAGGETSTTSGVGGAGGAGGGTTGTGGAACVGETGTAVVGDCEKLNIAPASGASSICGDNFDQPPPGYGLCSRAFEIFNDGAATNLVACLGTIGVQDACKIEPLQVCVDKMFADECDIQSIKTTCESIKTQCGADPFNSDICAKDLNPFSDAGLLEISNCFNMADPQLSCQQAYDDCYTQVLTF